MKAYSRYLSRCYNAATVLLIVLCALCANEIPAQGVMVDTEDVTCHGRSDGKAKVTGGNATQPFTYQWSHNALFSASRVIDLPKGNHSVTVTDANQCTAVLTFTINEPERLKLTTRIINYDYNFCDNTFCVTVEAIATGGTPPYTYSPKVQTRCSPGPMYFMVIDKNGCVQTTMTSFAEARSACRGSFDPNDIVGPEGFDDLQWMSVKNRMHYMIRYENDPELATGPAQFVEIRHEFHELVNPLTFRLGDFGFGPYVFEVPDNRSFYQERIDLTQDLGIFLDVVAGLDVVNNRAFWLLETIDPATGLRPIDLTIGFLPPNDTLVDDGQGFVNFSVLPRTSVVTRDTIAADALIIFDNNEPIITNLWENTMDALPPVTTLDPLPDTTASTIIELSWQGEDDPMGSGISRYQLYSSVNGAAFKLHQADIPVQSFTFEGVPGYTYAFYVLGVDNTGNVESKSVAEETVFVLPLKSLEVLSPLSQNQCAGNLLTIDWAAVLVDTVDVFLSLDSGETFQPIFTELLTVNKPYTWPIPDTLSVLHAQIRLVQTNHMFETTGPFFAIRPLPNVSAGPDVTICANAVTNLIASGANSYSWLPVYHLSNPNHFSTAAYPDTTTTYTVTGTSVFGCQNTDSVVVNVLQLPRDTMDIEICAPDSIFAGGAWQHTTGFYTDVFGAANGCDSLFVTALTVYDPCVWPGGDIVYVNHLATGNNTGYNWEDAFTALTEALRVSNMFDNILEIWVAEGVYYPTAGTDRTLSFVFKDSTKVFGGFIGAETERAQRDVPANPVLLSGDIGIPTDSTDNSFNIVRIDTTCMGCVLDGLTISFGHADGLSAPFDRGAGVYSHGSATLRNVILEHHTATMGAAITHRGADSELIVEDCIIRLSTSGLSGNVLNLEGAILRLKGNVQVDE